MEAGPAHPLLGSILANLGREIAPPLDALREEIGRFLDDPDRITSEAERVQAATLLTLCDELGTLTREHLGRSTATGPASDDRR